MTESKPVSKRLFVGSLPYRFTEGQLLELFIPEGKIISLRILHNRWGKSRGMGYVEYENINDATRAKEKYHNFRLADRTIIVDYAQPDPFLTPEGQARHQEALEKHPQRRQSPNYLPHPDSDQTEYRKRSSQIHSKNYSPGQKISKKPPKNKGGKPVFSSVGKSLNRTNIGEFTPKFFPKINPNKKKFKPRPGQKPEYKSSSPLHVRSSVFKQRSFGARVGAKFVAKSKKK